MDFVQQQIAEIQKEDNTAQASLASLLVRTPKATTDLMILEEWSGDLDFSLLGKQGFHNVHRIEIPEGSITQIAHLPQTLKTLVCRRNLLTSLRDLPKGLSELTIIDNYLETLDLAGLTELKKLVVSGNQLKTLAPLGPHLEIVECDHNHLASLDLLPCKKLVRLHCSENPILIVKDPPPSLIDFEMDSNPLTEVQRKYKATDGKENEKKIDYAEAISAYFRMKAAYEEKELDLKRAAYRKEALKREGRKRAAAVRAPCVNCKRKVGTVFSCKKRKYTAVCGDAKEPCSLNIQIVGEEAYSLDSTLYEFKKILEDRKDAIVRQKMDTLFHYLTESDSAKVFKESLEEYHSTHTLFKELLESYDELYNNPHTKELIRRKEAEVYQLMRHTREMLKEYQKKIDAGILELEEEDAAQTILRSVIETYNNDLVNQIHSLRMLKNAVVEVEEVKEKDKPALCTLRKYPVVATQLAYSLGEPARVLHFAINKNL